MLDLDLKFSTTQSFKLSKLLAFEILQNYFDNAIFSIGSSWKNYCKGRQAKQKPSDRLQAALVELVYAMHSRGSINNGKGDVKQIVVDVESFFNIQVGNFIEYPKACVFGKRIALFI